MVYYKDLTNSFFIEIVKVANKKNYKNENKEYSPFISNSLEIVCCFFYFLLIRTSSKKY